MNNVPNLGTAGAGAGLIAAKKAEDDKRAALIAEFRARKGSVATIAEVAKALPATERAKRDKVQKEQKTATAKVAKDESRSEDGIIIGGARNSAHTAVGARSYNLPTQEEIASAVSLTDAKVSIAVTKAHGTLSIGEVAIAAREAGSLDANSCNIGDLYARFRNAAQEFSALKKEVAKRGGIEKVAIDAESESLIVYTAECEKLLADNAKMLFEKYLAAEQSFKDTRDAYKAAGG